MNGSGSDIQDRDGNFSEQAPPVALSIAGSDSSAGAGIQADLKTFSALGVYGLTAVTCVVAETPGKVLRIDSVDPELVEDQIGILMSSFPVRAIKTGLLHSAAIMKAVLRSLEQSRTAIPIVVDPVMIATSGDRLLDQDALEIYTGSLFPRARLITPNLDEAAVLLGEKISDPNQMIEAASALSGKFRTAVLLKGGHLAGDEALDVLSDNGKTHRFVARRIHGIKTHGTGCTYSAAITAGLARDFALDEAIENAKAYVSASLAAHFDWGGVHALNHTPGTTD